MLARHAELRQLKAWNGHLYASDAQLLVRILLIGSDCPGLMEARERALVLSHPQARRRRFDVTELIGDLLRMPANHVAFMQVFQSDERPLVAVREGACMVTHPSARFAGHLSVFKGGVDEYAVIEAGHFNLHGKTALRVAQVNGAELMRLMDEYRRAGTSRNSSIEVEHAEVLWDVQPTVVDGSPHGQTTETATALTVRHPGAVFSDTTLMSNGWSAAAVAALRAGLLG